MLLYNVFMELNFTAKLKIINPDNPYADLSGLSVFNATLLHKIQFYAEALSDREMLDMFGIRELSDLSDEDQRVWTYACGQSRRLAVHRATRALFDNMKQKTKGMDSCLHYLRQNGEAWANAGGSDNGPVKFEVTLTQ